MGVTSSKAASPRPGEGRGGLVEHGLEVQRIRISHHHDISSSEGGNDNAVDDVYSLDITKTGDGTGLQLTASLPASSTTSASTDAETPTTATTSGHYNHHHQPTFVLDPSATNGQARQVPDALLLKVTKYQDEEIKVAFTLRLTDTAAIPTTANDAPSLSLACVRSQAELDRILQERQRNSLQRHPALSVVQVETDQHRTGHLSFTWRPSFEAAAVAKQDGREPTGKRECYLLRYQPHANSFDVLLTFSFWLEAVPHPRTGGPHVSTPQLIANLTSYVSPPTTTAPASESAAQKQTSPMNRSASNLALPEPLQPPTGLLAAPQITEKTASPPLTSGNGSSSHPAGFYTPFSTTTTTTHTDYLSPPTPINRQPSPSPRQKRSSLQFFGSSKDLKTELLGDFKDKSYKRASYQNDYSTGALSHSTNSDYAPTGVGPNAHAQYAHYPQTAHRFNRPSARRSSTSPQLPDISTLPTSPGGVSSTSLSHSMPPLQSPPGHTSNGGSSSSWPSPAPLASGTAILNNTDFPQLEPMEEIPEDGPLFRAHLKSMEERTVYLRKNLKTTLKTLEQILAAKKQLNYHEDVFDFNLNEITTSNPLILQFLNDNYWLLARRIDGFVRKEQTLRLEELLLEPLRRVVASLKTVDYKKRTFEQESKAYYDHMHRYLAVRNDNTGAGIEGGRTKIATADEKHKAKKDRFTVARIDYFNSLRDLTTFKEFQILQIFLCYIQTIHQSDVNKAKDLDAYTAFLNDFKARIDEVNEEIETRKLNIESQRRALETALAQGRIDTNSSSIPQAQFPLRQSFDVSRYPANPTPKLQSNELPNDPAASSVSTVASSLTSSQVLPSAITPHLSVPGFEGQPPASPGGTNARKKEGFLWANSKPVSLQDSVDAIKHWHKYWVVLSGGQLCEYADDILELKSTPINLRFATVKETRAPADPSTAGGGSRRFTFEVITPNIRRVYQATSTEDMKEWVAVIANVIQSLLDGTSSVRHFGRSPGSNTASPTEHGGLGIYSSYERDSPSMAVEQDQAGLSGFRDNKEAGGGDGMKAVLAKLNKPLQRRVSSGGKHAKRDSVSSIVSNFTSNARRKDRDRTETSSGYLGSSNVGGATQHSLATLREASQSMASFFTDSSNRVFNPAGHAKSASSNNDRQTGNPRSPTLTNSKELQGENSVSPAPAQHLSATTGDQLDVGIEQAVNSAFRPTKPQQRQSKASKEWNARQLQALMRLPENRRCADCDAADPRWASWNLGIFICIRCSGIHRSLGSHISKVRSTDLDDWSDEQLQNMRDIGNGLARQMWEPPDLPGEMRSSENITKLIKLKYVKKRWNQSKEEASVIGNAL